MIRLDTVPQNEGRFRRLMEFTHQLLEFCQELGIEPVLSGSLAVLAYTHDERLQVNDVDLSCREADFDRIMEKLMKEGILCKRMDWHTLQVWREDLKVEFDAREVWMSDMPEEHEILLIDGEKLKMVSFEYLQKLYQRGLDATARSDEATAAKKHADIQQKLKLLLALHHQ